MSVQEETQGGGMKGGGREEDRGGGSKRARDEEQNPEQVDRQDECLKKRRMRSENWSAKDTLQMLELRKAIVQTSTARGSDAWKQIAQKLAGMNPKSQARSWKRVSQRWDTLVKVFVSVEEECCETGKSFGEVIGERQKRCKTEYRQLWHELIAQGNPGKRRAPGKTAVQPDEAPTACSANGIITEATPASLSPGASLAVMTHAWKFGEIAKRLTEMLDTIDRSISFSEERSEVIGQGDHKNIVTGSKSWEYEEDQERGLKNQQDETNAEVARTTQLMAETMQNISKAASRSESFCLQVDLNDWLTVIERLSAISHRFQTLSVQRIREEVGADVRIPRVKIISASRSTYDLNNSTQPTLSVISPATSTDTFTRLSNIEPLSPGLSDVISLLSEPSDHIMALSPQSVWTSSTMDDLGVSLSQRKIDVGATDAVMEDYDVFLNHRGPDVKAGFVAHLHDALRYAGGYAKSESCLNELVAMIRSGRPVIPVFYDVELGDLRWLEDGPFAEAFEKHKLKGTTENKVLEWAGALRALAHLEITGFHVADFESDKHKLNWEVVKQISRLIPSIEPVQVEDYNVDLKGCTQYCIHWVPAWEYWAPLEWVELERVPMM